MPYGSSSAAVVGVNWYSTTIYYNGMLWSHTPFTKVNDGQRSGFSKTTTGSLTPSFGTIRDDQRWKLPIHSYEKLEQRMHAPASFWQQINAFPPSIGYYGNTGNIHHYLGAIGYDGAYVTDDPTQRAVSRLIDQISLGKANLAVSAAEFGKTASMVASRGRTIVEALLALKKCQFGKFAQSLNLVVPDKRKESYERAWKKARAFDRASRLFRKTNAKFSRSKYESRVTDLVSNTWLEFSYGWKPLLQDVYDNAEALADLLEENNFEWRTVTAKARTKRTWDMYAPDIYWTVRHQYSSEAWVKFGISYALPPGAVNTVNVFGLSNPATVVWELVPFSFVADWFLPIGDAIAAITAYDGLIFRDGYKSSRHVWSHQRDLQGKTVASSGGAVYLDSAKLNDVHNLLHVKRDKLYSFPQYGFPKFKDPRSLAHGASAVALLQSLFLRK